MVQRLRATAVLGVLLGCAAGLSTPARAQTRRAVEDACYAAAVDAQRLRKASHLLESREKLLACAAPSCPDDAAKLCGQWLAEVTASTPTVVISAKDGADRDVVDARVTLDGALFTDKLDGVARPMNPGTHMLRCQFAGDRVVEQEVVIHEGEKNRIIPLRFGDPSSRLAPPPAAAPRVDAPAHGSPVLGWTFVGVGVASLGTFAALALAGQSSYATWDKEGRPAGAEATSLQTQRTLSFVALGVGVAASGVGAWLLLRGHGEARSAAASGVGLAPVEGGASLLVRHAF